MLPPCGEISSRFLQKGPLRLKSRLNLSMGTVLSLLVLILLIMSCYECFVSIIILVFLDLPFPLILGVRS